MKTSRLMVLALCLAGSLSTEVMAQMYLPAFHFRVHTGYTVPAAPSDFNNYYKTGPNVGGVVSYRLPSSWEFAVSGYWTGFDLNEGQIVDDYQAQSSLQEMRAGGGDAQMLAGFAEARYNWQIKPTNGLYALAGVGVRKWKRDEVSMLLANGDGTSREEFVLEEADEIKPALVIGGGGTAALSRLLHLFIEAQYDVTFTEETLHSFPVKVGLLIHLTR